MLLAIVTVLLILVLIYKVPKASGTPTTSNERFTNTFSIPTSPNGSYCPYRSLIGEWDSRDAHIKFSPNSNGTAIDMYINGQLADVITRFNCVQGNTPGNLTIISNSNSFKITSTSKDTLLNMNGQLFTHIHN